MFVGVGIVVIDDTDKHNLKVMLLHRVLQDTWEIPGGKVDDGETPEKAVKRETWEESNLEFTKDPIFLGEFSHWGRDRRKWWLSKYYLAMKETWKTPLRAMAAEPKNHDRLDWFSINSLPKMDEVPLRGIKLTLEYLEKIKPLND
jgi:8-oxo-dGTP pyrophosphatase MutT (NUDIX family)